MCFEGLGSKSHGVFSGFVRGSREISPVPSLYRESTDSLISSSCLSTENDVKGPLKFYIPFRDTGIIKPLRSHVNGHSPLLRLPRRTDFSKSNALRENQVNKPIC